MGDYNLTSEDKIHKYTLNIPNVLYEKLNVKCRQAGFAELAPYLRAVISREVLDGNFNIKDILGEKEFYRRETEERMKKEFPPMRRDGFIKISIKKIQDLINPKQSFFEW